MATKNNGTLDDLAEGCGCGVVAGLLGLAALGSAVLGVWEAVTRLFS